MPDDSHEAQIESALHDIAIAGAALDTAKRARSIEAVSQAEREMRATVDAARDLGVAWGRIGLALGVARGNAYQRFRRKPCPTGRARRTA